MKLLLQVAGIILLSLGSLHAQSASVVTGISPFHSYDFGDIDTVELSHGNVNLHIPIVSYKQLGQLPPFSISLSYNANSWIFSRYLNGQPAGPNSPADSYGWDFLSDNTNGVQVIAEPDFRINLSAGQLYADDPNSAIQMWHAVETTGASHLLAHASVGNNYLALDASGLTWSRQDDTLQDSHGIKYSGLCNSSGARCYSKTISDALGNTITGIEDSSNLTVSWTDSVGRSIPGMSFPSDGCVTKNYPGPYPVQFCWQTNAAQTDFPDGPYPGGYRQGIGTFIALSSVTLPNNQQWAFTYNSWGELETIHNPLGAVVTYEWSTENDFSCAATYNPFTRAVTKRTLTENGTSYVWSYTHGVETTPEGNTINHIFGSDCGRRETKTEYIDKNTGLQRTVLMEYASLGQNPFAAADGDNGNIGVTLKTRTTILPDNSTSQECFIYDDNLATDCTGPYIPSPSTVQANGPVISGVSSPISVIRGSLLYSSETDYGAGSPGAVIRKRSLHYKWQDDPDFVTKSLLDKVSSETIKDGNDTPLATTTYGYDAVGNNTSITREGPGNPSISTQTVFDATTGMPMTLKDAKLNETKIGYADNGLFPRSIAAGGLSDSYEIDRDIQVLSSHTDPNQVVTKYLHTDPLGRITQIQRNLGLTTESQTTYSYPSATVINTSQDQTTKNDGLLQGAKTTDGLGRTIQTIGPDGTIVDTVYTYDGKVSAVSNPHFAGESSVHFTSYLYDVLRRVTRICQADNVQDDPTVCAPNNSYVGYDYTGNHVAMRDEVGNTWTRATNALGSLTDVTEPGPLTTHYDYSPLGNLIKVTQNGKSVGDSPRIRNFSYDSLSRLLAAKNPEEGSGLTCPGTAAGTTWSTCYTYDLNGNLKSKTNARGITTTYCYDALNRLLSKKYSGEVDLSHSTLTSCYRYDSEANAGSNTKGRLVSEWTQSGDCDLNGVPTTAVSWRDNISYDPMGRVTSELQCASAPCSAPNPLQYRYDLAGNLTYSNNGLANSQTPQIGFTNSYDGAGRFDSVTSTWDDPTHPVTLFKATQYSPFGLSSANIGLNSTNTAAVLAETRSYDVRGRVKGASATAQQIVTTPSAPTLYAVLSANPVVVGTSPTVITLIGCTSGCGVVSYLMDGQSFQQSAVKADGTIDPVSISSALVVGTHAITINYGGDATHAPTTTSVSFTVVSSGLTLTASLDVNPVPADETPRMLAHVNCSACGVVQYYVDGVVFQNANIESDGSAVNVLRPTPSLGRHVLTVSYPGNATYPAASTSFPFQVVPDTLSSPALSAALSTNPVLAGTSPGVITTLGCTYDCGWVYYYLDSSSQAFQIYEVRSDGTVASPPVSSALAVGPHTITVKYGGNAYFSPVSKSVSFTVVSTAPTGLTASLDVNPVPADETPRMLSHVSCSACGSVFHYLDGVLFQNANIDTNGNSWNALRPTPSLGWHILTVSYPGNATYSAASTSFAFQVIPDNLPAPTLSAALSTNPVVAGTSPGVVTALGCTYDCGWVYYYMDGSNQPFQTFEVHNDGTVSSPPISSALAVGPHTITVKYGGNAYFSPVSKSVSFTVVSSAPTGLTASLDVNPVPADETPQMLAHVSCSACGIVQFYLDGVAYQFANIISDGSAKNLLTPTPALGRHILTVRYPGNATYSAASASFAFQVVPDNLPAPTLSATLSTNPVLAGTSPGVITTLGCTYDCGWVYYYMDGSTQPFQIYEVRPDGSVSSPPISSTLELGSHFVTVKYGGNASFSPISKTVPFTVVSTQ